MQLMPIAIEIVPRMHYSHFLLFLFEFPYRKETLQDFEARPSGKFQKVFVCLKRMQSGQIYKINFLKLNLFFLIIEKLKNNMMEMQVCHLKLTLIIVLFVKYNMNV